MSASGSVGRAACLDIVAIVRGLGAGSPAAAPSRLDRDGGTATAPRPRRYAPVVSLLLLVDLDGVVYRGADPVPGVAAVLADRAARGDDVVYVTNNSMHYRADYVTRLSAMGAPVTAETVVSSARATALHIANHEPGIRRVLVLGAGGLERELRDVGLDVVTAGHAATRMHQEGIDGWTAAGAPDAVVDRPRPEPDLPAPRRGRRLRPRRRPVHRHQPRPGLPDGARPPARRREHRGRARGHDGRDPVRRSASPARICSSWPPRPSAGTRRTR